ncbi:prepilin peptidase [Kyrpidia spormannii]|uniref:Prepilin leader peptidase/N-methyltransferase n=1 Tax=Kyrpidia spormannii TaxID=2055160 RepID=A0A6F9EIM5_9BACL|nr:A24 family peptidase [Kyrpidia spormannii]CAB3396144.1 Leader peptidase / N-methyltransferase [Kyrpidia spormannii]
MRPSVVIYAICMGLIIGSFLNVVAYRLPRGESVVFPPSRCPRCGARIRPQDLIPVVSWVWLRGRCRDCGGTISWRYPVMEAMTGGLWGLAAWRYGWSWETALGLVVISFLIALSAIDLQWQILPDELTYPLAIVVVGARLWMGPEPWWWYVGGAALGAGMLLTLYWLSPLLFGKEGMGLGDVKLMVGLGAFNGLTGTVITLFAASLAGLVVGLVLQQMDRIGEQRRIPFGPFLAGGALLSWLYGDALMKAYFGLFV